MDLNFGESLNMLGTLCIYVSQNYPCFIPLEGFLLSLYPNPFISLGSPGTSWNAPAEKPKP